MLVKVFPFYFLADTSVQEEDRNQCCVNGLHMTERESGTVLLGLKLAPVNKASAWSSSRLAHCRVRLLTVVLKQSVTQGWLITVSWTRKWGVAGFTHEKLWKAGIKRQPVSLALPALSACAQVPSVLETKQTQVAPGHCHGKGVDRFMTFQKDFQSSAEVMEISIFLSKKPQKRP